MAADQRALIKKALGRIKKLAMTSTAERYKKRLESKKAPPPDEKPPEVQAAPELDETDESDSLDSKPEPEGGDETDPGDDTDPDDIMKKTSLVIMTRAPSKKSEPAPTKRKPGRPKKM